MTRALTLAALIFALLPSAVRADSTQYSFVSTPFNTFTGTACPPTCDITGSFIVAEPLPPNQSQGIGGSGQTTPLSFSFTDGTLTWTNLNSVDSGFNFDTDSLGNITNYSFYADLSDGSDISAFFDGPTQITQLFVSNNSAGYNAAFSGEGASGGTWSVKTIPSLPEPSSIFLIGVGLLALAGFTFKRRLA